MNESRDHVIIVGAGVVGLTTAVVLLARTSHLSVTVLERASVGDGASRYAGALDVPYFLNAFQRRLVETSWSWHEARGARADEYRRRVPMTWYAEPGSDLQSRVAIRLTSAEGVGCGSVQRSPVGARTLRGTSFVIDPRAWCRALAREVVESGRGEVAQGAELVSLEPADGAVRATCADRRSFLAQHVVLALGAWLPDWDNRTRAWAAGIGLRTKRVFGLNLDVDIDARPTGAVGWPDADMYLHPAPVGDEYRLSLRHDEWDVSPDAEHRMAGAVLDRAGAFLDQVLGSRRWSFAGHRVFVDSYTPDSRAVVGACTTLGERVTVATGTHGSGVRMAPGIAELTARSVLENMGPTWRLS